MTDPTHEDGENAALIRDSAAGYIKQGNTIARARRLHKEGKLDREAWREIAELGWLGLMLPESCGGSDLKMREFAALLEQLGRGCVPEPLVQTSFLAGRLASRLPGAAGVALASSIADGSLIVPLAWQERAGELSASHIAARAENVRGAWKLSGEKRFVAGAAEADAYLVAARGDAGVGLFRVVKQAPSLSVETARSANGGSVGSLILDGVAADAVIAEPGSAEAALDATLDEGRVALSAQMLGLMSQLFEMTLGYLRTRKQFGRAIGSFQALQHRAVDLHVQVQLSRAAVARATRLLDNSDDAEARAAAASACKARVSDACLKVMREAIQMHGAIAYTDEHDVSVFMREALTLSAALGNAPAHRRRFGLITARHIAA